MCNRSQSEFIKISATFFSHGANVDQLGAFLLNLYSSLGNSSEIHVFEFERQLFMILKNKVASHRDNRERDLDINYFSKILE